MAKRTQEDLLVPESIIVKSQRRRGEREREVAKVAGDIVLSVFFINMAGY